MTPEQHRARHVVLHKCFDELLADFLLHHRGKHLGDTTLLELMRWSSQQMDKPAELDP